METTFLQQGDTLLFRVESIPKKAKKLKGSILHYGNTGNHHKLGGSSFQILQEEETKYLDVKKPTPYTHEEHKKITIPKGTYVLKFVQERDHFTDLTRPVVD